MRKLNDYERKVLINTLLEKSKQFISRWHYSEKEFLKDIANWIANKEPIEFK